jgi:GNAT superfamily N-acetyltransferase
MSDAAEKREAVPEVSVRLATVDDVPVMLKYAMGWHYKSRMARLIKFEDCIDGWTTLLKRAVDLIGHDASTVLLGLIDGVPRGMYLTFTQGLPFAPEVKAEAGLVLWVDPGHRGRSLGTQLINAGEVIARKRGAVARSGAAHRWMAPHRMSTLLRRHGFEKETTNYTQFLGAPNG